MKTRMFETGLDSLFSLWNMNHFEKRLVLVYSKLKYFEKLVIHSQCVSVAFIKGSFGRLDLKRFLKSYLLKSSFKKASVA